MFYIFDETAYEEESTDFEECVITTEDLKETTMELLEQYYELDPGDYGDPISDLLDYIPVSKLKELLLSYRYMVFTTKKAVFEHMKAKEKSERHDSIMGKLEGVFTYILFYHLKENAGLWGKTGDTLLFYTLKDDFMNEHELSGKLRVVNLDSGDGFAPAFQWKPDFDHDSLDDFSKHEYLEKYIKNEMLNIQNKWSVSREG